MATDGSEVVEIHVKQTDVTSRWFLTWRGRMEKVNVLVTVGFFSPDDSKDRFSREYSLVTKKIQGYTDQPIPGGDTEFCPERIAVYEELSKELNQRSGNRGMFVISITPWSRPRAKK